MPHAPAKDGTNIFFEETGPADHAGDPLIFVHEFAGDHRSWDDQVRYFSWSRRCITMNARGYPPSDVPEDPADYSQEHQADDIAAVLDHLAIGQADVVGCSMGSFASLHFALRHGARARSLFLSGIGSGAPKGAQRARFIKDSLAAADGFQVGGSARMAEGLAVGPTRVQLQNKDPKGWARFKAHLAEHDSVGAANTLRGYQAARPSLYDLADKISALAMPALIAVGDEDEPCLDASLWLKRQMPLAGLWVAPKTGHCINLEEPAAFNAMLATFLADVAAGAWAPRDSRARVMGSFLVSDED